MKAFENCVALLCASSMAKNLLDSIINKIFLERLITMTPMLYRPSKEPIIAVLTVPCSKIRINRQFCTSLTRAIWPRWRTSIYHRFQVLEPPIKCSRQPHPNCILQLKLSVSTWPCKQKIVTIRAVQSKLLPWDSHMIGKPGILSDVVWHLRRANEAQLWTRLHWSQPKHILRQLRIVIQDQSA